MTAQTTAKISLIGQIAEIDREIGERQKLYPRLVNEGKMKEEHRKMLMDRILSVRATLLWVQSHEADFRAWMAEQKREVAQR
ncbi:hypothetical protein SAMN05421890_1529 [Ensifer adhaerens]|nr:hypothetical protein SAMN05421890_1529 [Ensifer adhaerens]